MKPNLIIRASAGTGKTFSLATRFIRLMLFQNVEPRTIVALTFSRAAAKEIYTKLLERLWTAAMEPEGAAKEERRLLDGLSPQDVAAVRAAGVAFTPERFAELLRKTVDSQEVGAIATLDSFILRIVRSFPLEMGFQHAVEVLDEYAEESARKRIGEELLAGDADAGDGRRQKLSEAFKVTQRGQFRRGCQAAFEKVLAGWHAFLVEHPEAREWTAESMAAALGIEDVAKPDLSAVRGSGKRNDPIDGAAKWIGNFTGEGKLFNKGHDGELMKFLVANPGETVYRYLTDSGKEKTFDCGAEGAAAIRQGVRWMVATALRRQIEIVAAKLAICKLFDGDYDAATRRRGQLTFADFTHCQAFSEDGGNPIALENIQYRFDERFTHWALDEFQDTSKLQWKCLRRLVQEAAAGDQRSVMVVGDLKQSIYGWRGGDDGPFREVMAMGEFGGDRGESLKNDVSYRYEAHTVDFINRVFGAANLRNPSLFGGAGAAAVDAWLGEECWMEHKADVYTEGSRAGQPKDGDYVEIVRVEKAQDGGRQDDEAGETMAADADDEDEGARCSAGMRMLAPKICNLVKELWRRHEEKRGGMPSKDTIGILVRENKDGAYLAERIRSIPDSNIPVVWEGVNGILDAPSVQATLELVRLASHPEDTFAWQAVNRLFPMREYVFPELTRAEDVSRRMCEMLTRLGLSRTLRSVVARLADSEAGLSARSVACLESLVRFAVAFESREEGWTSVEAFLKFLAAKEERDTGESPRVVRILTIHRSKGLTLDHVIVPIVECGNRDSITEPDRRQRLEGEGWAMEMPSEELARRNPVLAAAWEKKANECLMETLRLNYVALTRARKSTYAMVVRDDHDSKVQFRDVLLAPFTGEGAGEPELREYGEVVFSDGTPFNFGYPKKEGGAAGEIASWTHRPGLPPPTRRTPSDPGGAVMAAGGVKSVATFFAATFGDAARKGIEAHAGYAAIEWIDPDGPKSDLEREILGSGFREAFVRPGTEASVWRERNYELLVGNCWETGQFDRVVFTGEGEARAATIYDFKTNARGANESEAAFGRRMGETYGAQMAAYRRALSRLTGIPPERIGTKLLLKSTGGVREVAGRCNGLVGCAARSSPRTD